LNESTGEASGHTIGCMATVRFEVRTSFDADPRRVWDEMIDWKGHEAWIPATRVHVDGEDPTAIGATFTAWTGIGPLSLEDRMRVTRCEWADDRGDCEVEKLGPVLRGRAGFTVKPEGHGCVVVWVEDVTVPYLPRALAPVLARLGAAGFRIGMRRLAKIIAR
jgi:carbon monoxide dehydrogenase subunit G